MQLLTGDGPTLQNHPTQSLKTDTVSWQTVHPYGEGQLWFHDGKQVNKNCKVSEILSYWDFTND